MLLLRSNKLESPSGILKSEYRPPELVVSLLLISAKSKQSSATLNLNLVERQDIYSKNKTSEDSDFLFFRKIKRLFSS